MKKDFDKHLRKIFKNPLKRGFKRVAREDKKDSIQSYQIDLTNMPTLHIPHIERDELERRFKIIKEVKTRKKEWQAPIKQAKESKKLGKISEFFKFTLTAGTVFAVLFFGLNYQAFSQIIDKKINPDKYTETQIGLEQVTANQKITRPKFLPTAGMKRENRKIFPSLNITVSPLENRIIIPKIAKNIPIVKIPENSLINEDWQTLENDIQDALKDGVVHYPGTAVPGQNGNVFITGHSSYYPWDNGRYKDVFALLHDLEVGDAFTIYWDQKKFDYQINERKVVKPEDVTVLDQPVSQKIATLMTCTPVGTAKNRLIITAEQLN